MRAIQVGLLLTDGRDGMLKPVFHKWMQGGAAREGVQAEYGPIMDWNAPQVTVGALGLRSSETAAALEGITSLMHHDLQRMCPKCRLPYSRSMNCFGL